MNILVTGGSGFIGSHLVNALVTKNHNVTNMDIKLPQAHQLPHKFVKQDITELIRKFGDDSKYDKVFHLAADVNLSAEKDWFAGRIEAMFTNAYGTYNVLKYSHPAPIIFASTAAIYGTQHNKVTEKSRLKCENYYSYSKAVAERMIEACRRDYVTYRFGTVIGTYGRTFLNRLVWCAVHNEPVEIFNNGNNVRTYIDVRDIVYALIKYDPADANTAFNLAGEEYVMKDVVKLVSYEAERRGLVLDYSFTEEIPLGLAKTVSLDTNKIKAHFGFKTKYTLKQSIKDMFDNYINDEGAYEPKEW